MNLRDNKLGNEGWCSIFDALHDNPQNKIAKWDLCYEGINSTVAKSLAAYMAVSISLTEVLAFSNRSSPALRMRCAVLGSYLLLSMQMAGEPGKKPAGARRGNSSCSQALFFDIMGVYHNQLYGAFSR